MTDSPKRKRKGTLLSYFNNVAFRGFGPWAFKELGAILLGENRNNPVPGGALRAQFVRFGGRTH